ncbi:MAG: hypothetical protein V4736_13365 [Bdellovibrionota bacterium]
MDVLQIFESLNNDTTFFETPEEESRPSTSGLRDFRAHGYRKMDGSDRRHLDQDRIKPEGLWGVIQDLVKNTKKSEPTGIQRLKHIEKKKPSFGFYEIEDVMEYLIKASHKIKDESERDIVQGGLMYLDDQLETPKYQRNQTGIRSAWHEIYPFLKKHKLVDVFPEGSWSRERIMTFLLGHY